MQTTTTRPARRVPSVIDRRVLATRFRPVRLTDAQQRQREQERINRAWGVK